MNTLDHEMRTGTKVTTLDAKEDDVMERRRTYTMAEVQSIIGTGRDKTYQLARNHAFPVVKLGRQYFAPKEAFDEWLLRCGSLVSQDMQVA